MSVLKKLYTKVEYILEHNIDARNSDFVLYEKLIKKYNSKMIHQASKDGKFIGAFVFLDDLFLLPRQSDVERWRRVIQNEEKRFIPTSWKVAQHRRWAEEDYKAALGYAIAYDNPYQTVMKL